MHTHTRDEALVKLRAQPDLASCVPVMFCRWTDSWAGEAVLPRDAGSNIPAPGCSDQNHQAAGVDASRVRSTVAAALPCNSSLCILRDAALPHSTAFGCEERDVSAAGVEAAAARDAVCGRDAADAGDGESVLGQELDAAAQNARLRSKQDACPNTCVYVGFLGWWVNERDLVEYFCPYGELVSVRVSTTTCAVHCVHQYPCMRCQCCGIDKQVVVLCPVVAAVADQQEKPTQPRAGICGVCGCGAGTAGHHLAGLNRLSCTGEAARVWRPRGAVCRSQEALI